jgi:hypothetical protein
MTEVKQKLEELAEEYNDLEQLLRDAEVAETLVDALTSELGDRHGWLSEIVYYLRMEIEEKMQEIEGRLE